MSRTLRYRSIALSPHLVIETASRLYLEYWNKIMMSCSQNCFKTYNQSLLENSDVRTEKTVAATFPVVQPVAGSAQRLQDCPVSIPVPGAELALEMSSEIDFHAIVVEQRVVAIEQEDDVIWHFQRMGTKP